MGILSKWRVFIFKKTEVALEQRLEENIYYPFQLVTDDSEQVFIYSSRHSGFYYSLVAAVVSFLLIIIWPATGGDAEFLFLSVAVFAISMCVCLEYFLKWSVVLEPASSHYSVHHGARLVASQHCHNIYVRVLCKKTGHKGPTYQLVLDGWGLINTICLTRHTFNRKKLRQLGHGIASRLNINYFDIHTVSKYHTIRHHRPHITNVASGITDLYQISSDYRSPT